MLLPPLVFYGATNKYVCNTKIGSYRAAIYFFKCRNCLDCLFIYAMFKKYFCSSEQMFLFKLTLGVFKLQYLFSGALNNQ